MAFSHYKRGLLLLAVIGWAAEIGFIQPLSMFVTPVGRTGPDLPMPRTYGAYAAALDDTTPGAASGSSVTPLGSRMQVSVPPLGSTGPILGSVSFAPSELGDTGRGLAGHIESPGYRAVVYTLGTDGRVFGPKGAAVLRLPSRASHVVPTSIPFSIPGWAHMTPDQDSTAPGLMVALFGPAAQPPILTGASDTSIARTAALTSVTLIRKLGPGGQQQTIPAGQAGSFHMSQGMGQGMAMPAPPLTTTMYGGESGIGVGVGMLSGQDKQHAALAAAYEGNAAWGSAGQRMHGKAPRYEDYGSQAGSGPHSAASEMGGGTRYLFPQPGSYLGSGWGRLWSWSIPTYAASQWQAPGYTYTPRSFPTGFPRPASLLSGFLVLAMVLGLLAAALALSATIVAVVLGKGEVVDTLASMVKGTNNLWNGVFHAVFGVYPGPLMAALMTTAWSGLTSPLRYLYRKSLPMDVSALMGSPGRGATARRRSRGSSIGTGSTTGSQAKPSIQAGARGRRGSTPTTSSAGMGSPGQGGYLPHARVIGQGQGLMGEPTRGRRRISASEVA